ncbi:carboxylesterase family protein [Phenylobacterium sp.]|uniref:carboxylesterase/lipase family protein n=1 Tax=Phenylobacterium sp. TaxID=1871053 RepID=UPI002608A731|nr:carboxylesterase family protein [Phenylobacterium sp.]
MMMVRGLTLALAAALSLAATAHAAIPEPVNTAGGPVIGMPAWGHGVRVFKGIPFAAPPIGPLRWRPPQPAAPWSGVLAATKFSPACMQQARPKGVAPWATGENGISEDCLYLNVWTPAKSAGDRLPVMVWIYGGGGREGSGAEALYAPDNLAKRGVVVVSFNYRVNLFGWMAHPALSAESPDHASGDYGALDQVAALRWVKANIAAFGGDPDKVTIFGESGGSRSVNWLMASPMARGLFRGAIAQSHTVFDRMETLKEAEARGAAFAAAAGAPSLEALRAMPAEALMAAYLKMPNPGMNAAIVDGAFLPADIRTIFEKGRQNDVALITGGTADEPGGRTHPGGPPKTAADYVAWLKDAYGPVAERLLAVYPAASDAQAQASYHALLRDANFAGHRTWARLQTKTGKAPVWLYLFSHAPPAYGPDGRATRQAGAPHGSDVAYAFDNLRYADLQWDAADGLMARITADYWVNFAKTGDPNGPGLSAWPKYDARSEQMLDLDLPPRARPVMNPGALDALDQVLRGRGR